MSVLINGFYCIIKILMDIIKPTKCLLTFYNDSRRGSRAQESSYKSNSNSDDFDGKE